MHDSPGQDRPRVSRDAGSTAPKAQLLSRGSHSPRATFPRTVTQKQQIQPKRLRAHHFIGAEFGRNLLGSALSGPQRSAEHTSWFSQYHEQTIATCPSRNRKTASRRSLRFTLLNVQTLSGFIQSALPEHKACPLVAGFEIHLRPEDRGHNILIIDDGECGFGAK